MTVNLHRLRTAVLFIAGTVSAAAQSPSASFAALQQAPPSLPSVPVTSAVQLDAATLAAAPAVQQLLDFRDSDVKFDLGRLMETLRDRRHEGWVLAAYPDPKTSRALIGAGFSLDLPAREHPQRDRLNPHSFLEPSSAELWQAAGLDPDRLQRILARYDERMATWNKKKFRKEIKSLNPDISDDDATQLLRISAIQAIYNARAYCRNFDSLTASQQMAMSQLVYQMGVNLEEFSQFLGLINRDTDGPSVVNKTANDDAGYWKAVQLSLTQSQWARLYRGRATSVIAMLDPQYPDAPVTAEHRVGAILRPAVVHRRGGRHVASLRAASYTRHHSVRSRKASRTRKQ